VFQLIELSHTPLIGAGGLFLDAEHVLDVKVQLLHVQVTVAQYHGNEGIGVGVPIAHNVSTQNDVSV
jgi:hypothetical protein